MVNANEVNTIHCEAMGSAPAGQDGLKMHKTDDFYSIPLAVIYGKAFFPAEFFGGF